MRRQRKKNEETMHRRLQIAATREKNVIRPASRGKSAARLEPKGNNGRQSLPLLVGAPRQDALTTSHGAV
ncbi:hypothetical protein N7468_003205 [Penicillium chermesinum]|uniref:Uncharacterized protein n=1 Tax=Penicillium chermesinum TaxID=63820 RepID=A0A9W9P6R1_9EURO|nr:uncharacterized protein N7468_003205 [Penicillium chermesinum]KAJ5238586.1 hypothetical protein N7468_003205 [Penicillium chermesinum]KAJ6164238.1 hypothetical protein N7470_002910 [Penicillium chermesinum]